MQISAVCIALHFMAIWIRGRLSANLDGIGGLETAINWGDEKTALICNWN